MLTQCFLNITEMRFRVDIQNPCMLERIQLKGIER